MAHRELFVRDFKQWLTGLLPPEAPRTGAELYTASTLNDLRSILIEIEQAGVFIAITTSIAGALVQSRATAVTIHELASYQPASPEVYRRVIDNIIDARIDPVVLLPIQAYHTRLSSALRLSRAIFDAGPAPTPNVRCAELERLEEAWQHVCGMALIVISTLRETLASVRFSRPPFSNEHVEALLRSAKAGGRPCIGKDGAVTMPRWAESRMHARQSVRVLAWVKTRIGGEQTVIENASRSGLGLSGVRNVVSSENVTVTLHDGEQLEGQIMWEHDGRAGVKLAAMLEAGHALIAGQPAARRS